MLGGAAATVTAMVLLAAVLAFAMAQPRGLTEATLAVPAALLVLALGVAEPAAALARVSELAPTVAFLAAILVLAHLAEVEGVFTWLGSQLATAGRGSPRRLLELTFVAAAGTTAVLSLDATVVLLTPIVFLTAATLRLPARPHVYACTHLANSASTLLPVSNLTNLLAFSASGLSFAAFTGYMALPWLAAIAVELAVFRRYFAPDLMGGGGAAPAQPLPAPGYALAVLAAALAGFGASSWVGVEPVWVAVAGALALAVRALWCGRTAARSLLRAASPLFCLFVLALGVLVEGVVSHGVGDALERVLPAEPTLLGLLGMATIAAVLANVLNNLPATLVLLAVLGPAPAAGIVLAMLLGVNIGPNLTYIGSLATLLWRRVLAGTGAAPTLTEFTRLGVLTVPACLLASVLALWAALQVGGG